MHINLAIGIGAQVSNTRGALWQVIPLHLPTEEARSVPGIAISQPGKGEVHPPPQLCGMGPSSIMASPCTSRTVSLEWVKVLPHDSGNDPVCMGNMSGLSGMIWNVSMFRCYALMMASLALRSLHCHDDVRQ